jgi:hypothetical protein
VANDRSKLVLEVLELVIMEPEVTGAATQAEQAMAELDDLLI